MSISVVTDCTINVDGRTLSWALGTLQAGDILVITMITDNSASMTMGAPTDTNCTFTPVVVDTTSAYCYMGVYTGVVNSTASITPTSVPSGGSRTHNGVCYVFPAADGYSLAGSPNSVDYIGSGAPSTSISDSSGSVLVVCNGDWNPVDGASRAYIGTVTEDNYSYKSGYGCYYFWHQDASGGSDTIGLTAPTGQKYSMGAVEVLFSTGSTSGPNYAGTATDLGGGSGSWSNVSNATGAPDTSDASWTAP